MNTNLSIDQIDFKNLIQNEVYEYYDGPILYSCFDNLGNIYFVISIEDIDEKKVSTWYYVQVSQQRFLLIRSGELPLNTLVKDPEYGFIFEVTTSYSGDVIEVNHLEPSDVPRIRIPEDDYALDYHSPTTPIPAYDLDTLGKAYIRRMLELRLMKTPKSKDIFINTKYVGEVLQHAQEFLLAATSQSVFNVDKPAGQYPKDVTQSGLTGVAGFSKNGMVRIQLASMQQINVLDETTLDGPFEIFGEWINRSPGQWSDFFQTQTIGHDIRGKYRNLLSTISKNEDVEFQASWTRSGNKPTATTRVITSQEAGFTAEIFGITKTEEDTPVVMTGKLVELDSENGHFRFTIEKGEKTESISGKANDPSVLEHKETTKYYTFLLVRHSLKDAATSKEKTKYTLMEIQDAAVLEQIE